MKKYCFAASMGGHLEEIACLKDIAREVDSFLVTEKGGFQEIRFCNRTRYVLQINRKEKTFLFKFIVLWVQSLIIMLQEKPDCVISTGALATFPISLATEDNPRPPEVAFFNLLRDSVSLFIPLVADVELDCIVNCKDSISVDIVFTSL